MRTAAMLHETPDVILMDLNAALLMQNTDPIQTCTTVYGEININSGAATITLAVAGHPPPMIVRTDGGVEATTARGTMLGVIHTRRLRRVRSASARATPSWFAATASTTPTSTAPASTSNESQNYWPAHHTQPPRPSSSTSQMRCRQRIARSATMSRSWRFAERKGSA